MAKLSAWTWAVAALAMVGCAGEGCSCMAQLEDGFPPEERHANAVQARVTPTGLAFFRDNFAEISDLLFEGGLAFDVPRSCGSDPKVCCYVPEGTCQLLFDLDRRPGDAPRFELEAVGEDIVQLTLRARMHSNIAMPVNQTGPLGGDIQCYVSVSSAWSGAPHITIWADLHLVDDPMTGEMRVAVGDTTVAGVSGGDVSISGGFLCNFGSESDAAAQLNGQLAAQLPDALDGFFCAECATDADCAPFGSCAPDGICELPGESRCMQSYGVAGRLPAAEVLGSLPIADAGGLDLYLAAGGFERSVGGGVSIGVLSGALASEPASAHACVPEVPPPPPVAVPESVALRGNDNPRTGQPFDIGVAVHPSFLDRAGWAAHQAGFLCLDVGASRVPLLTSSSLSILAPSLVDLVHGEDVPLFLRVRPQAPPTFALGAGTLAEGPGGDTVIDEPLLEVTLDDMEIDLYAFIDERYVRILTLTADLVAPVGLDIDGNGDVLPVLGDLAEGFSDIRVTHSGLLAETPAEIAARFPAVLSVALPGLADELGAFEVPAFSGIALDLTADSIVPVDDQSFLAVLGDLAVADPAARIFADTELEVVGFGDGTDETTVELRLGGDAPGTSALEWQVRVDGGFWSPYTRRPRIALRRQAFLLTGRHVIEARARIAGAPLTADREPAVAYVDVQAPDRARLPAGGDERGDVTVGFHGSAGDSGCNCRADGGDASSGAGTIALALLVAWSLRRRRRSRAALAVLGCLALLAIGCGGSGSGAGDDDDDDDMADPTVVQPGPTGRWASMDAGGDRVVLAAYEQDFGDLVLAELDGEGRPAFRVIDGAPAGPVVLDPQGYRGGVREPGADVGAWTSTRVIDGAVHIAYQDRDRGALRLAVEAAGGFAVHDIDVPPEGEVGRYASLAVAPDGRLGVAYLAIVPSAAEGPGDEPPMIDVELRFATAAAAPASTADWTLESVDRLTVEAEPVFHDVPIGTGLFAGAAYLSDGTPAIAYYDQVAGDLVLATRDAKGAWTRQVLDGAGTTGDRGQWASLAVAADDTVHVAYQDANRDRLLAVSWSAGEVGPIEVIDDGRRDGDRPHSVGGSARLIVDGAGGLIVAYQDGTTSDLVVARRTLDGPWTREDLLTGPVGHGFHIAAATTGDTVWLSTYAYDQSSWPPGHTEVMQLP